MRLGTIIFIIYMEGKKDYIPLNLNLCSLYEKREPNIAGIKVLSYKMIKHVKAKFKT